MRFRCAGESRKSASRADPGADLGIRSAVLFYAVVSDPLREAFELVATRREA
jgi:hypothetical protein